MAAASSNLVFRGRSPPLARDDKGFLGLLSDPSARYTQARYMDMGVIVRKGRPAGLGVW